MAKKGSILRELPIIVVSALVVSIIVKTFFVHFFFIPSGSMENTLQVGDRIAVNKLASYFSEIKRGEVVVFRDPAGWLGTPSESNDPKLIQSIKSGLVTVGVLPDPAKLSRLPRLWRGHQRPLQALLRLRPHQRAHQAAGQNPSWH